MSYISDTLTRDEFFKKVFAKSGSEDSRGQAEAALINLDRYSLSEYKKTTGEILKDLKNEPSKALRYLDRFNQWLTEEHEIDGKKVKPRHPRTIKQYFSVCRRYMKLCGGVRINDDDVKEYITFPDLEADEEEAEPFEPKELRLILDSTKEQRRKTMYMCKKDTGGRIKEMGQLQKQNFSFFGEYVEVTFPKAIVKGKHKTRRAFLTKETGQRVKLLLRELKDDDFVFKERDQTPIQFRDNEGHIFRTLLRDLGFTEKYQHNDRYKKNLHSIRAFCSTQYSLANNSEEAGHGYIGHKKYLEQYVRLSDEQKIERFRRAEAKLSLYDEIVVVEPNIEEMVTKRVDEVIRKLRSMGLLSDLV